MAGTLRDEGAGHAHTQPVCAGDPHWGYCPSWLGDLLPVTFYFVFVCPSWLGDLLPVTFYFVGYWRASRLSGLAPNHWSPPQHVLVCVGIANVQAQPSYNGQEQGDGGEQEAQTPQEAKA